MKKKQKQTYLVSKDELVLIQLFIVKKMSLKDSIEIICNRDVDLLYSIKRGDNIIDSESLKQKGLFFKYLRILMSYNSFEDSICLANEFSQFNREIKSKVISLLTYPLVLILFAIGIYLVFSYNLLPLMLNLIDSNSTYILISDILIVINDLLIMVVAILLVSFIVIILQKEKRKRIIASFKNKKIVKEYNSYLFSMFYTSMSRQGITTKNMLGILSRFKLNYYLKSEISYLHDDLLKGIELEKSLINHNFSKDFLYFINVGIKNGECTKMLDNYIELQQNKWLTKLKKICNIITTVSYSIVIFLCIIMYQVMLLPINQINNI